MKKCLISALVFLHLQAAGQTDSIPNAGFEVWNFSGWGINPDGWQVNNSQILPYNVVPDSDSYSGTVAMKLINSGNFRPYAACNFLLTHVPQGFSGFFNNELLLNDTATLTLRIYSAGQLVDSGASILTGGLIISGYYPFMVSLSGSASLADSAEIILEGGTQYLSQVTYDELSLTFSTGLEEKIPQIRGFYPNPCNSGISISLEPGIRGSLEITDAHGRIVVWQPAADPSGQNRMDLSSLANGPYFLLFRTEAGISSLPLVKQ